jgi:regulatory protein
MGEFRMDERSDAFRAAFDAAVRILARRSHTRYEIRLKLRQRKYPGAVVDAVIAECERLRYVDDEATAGFYFRELVRKGFGAGRIRFEMKRKGLSGGRAEALITAYAGSAEEAGAAEAVLVKRLSRHDREADPQKRRAKIYRFMAARGFSADTIRELMERWM